MTAPSRTKKNLTGDLKARTVLLTLGSNIDPEEHIFKALKALDRLLVVKAVSSIYEAEPIDAQGTPKFLNAAVRIETTLSPSALKHEVLRPLEIEFGRVRGTNPNSPRTIDIDIAAVENLVLTEDDIGFQLPDPAITKHAHLALPLRDAAPNFWHPVANASLDEIGRRFMKAPGIFKREDLTWQAS
jgi:2-amino-4-hydroxy-6-hydroxymethyldihydropteridine diphosphokinase